MIEKVGDCRYRSNVRQIKIKMKTNGTMTNFNLDARNDEENCDIPFVLPVKTVHSY